MSRHAFPASHRCLWCRRGFNTVAERATHEHLLHSGNLARSQEAEAAAKLHHLHQDRRLIELGRPVPETPADLGRQLANRMRGLDTPSFWREADLILDAMRDLLLEGGQQAPAAYAVCRDIRLAARREWARLDGQERPANDG